MAIVANDKPFLDAFAAGRSPHIETSEQLFGEPCGKGDERYTFSKSFTYRKLYTHPDAVPALDGGQLRTYRVDVSPMAMQRFSVLWDQQHPAIVEYKRRTIAGMHRTGRVANSFGRYRDLGWAAKSYTDKLRTHAEQAALNYRIQGDIGEIMNDAFVRAWDELEKLFTPQDATLIIQCHDELVAWCKYERDVRPVAATLKWAIERPVPELGDAVIPAETKVGPSWGAMKPYVLEVEHAA